MTNPYRPGGRTYLNNATNHLTARRVVIGIAIYMVAQTVGLMLIVYVLSGDTPEVSDAIRLVLTTTLAIFLFAGSNVARWLTIVCYGLSVVFAVAALPALFKQGSIAAPLMLLLAVTNAAIPLALKLIPGMDDHFA